MGSNLPDLSKLNINTGAAGRGRFALVVGIDFGTTYSGIAWSHTSKTDISDIDIVCTWPRSNDGTGMTMDKVPTEIGYPTDGNPLWGYGIRGAGPNRNIPVYGWFKLLLDSGTTRTRYDDSHLPSQADPGDTTLLLTLPPGKTASDLARDYLKGIHSWIMELLATKLPHTINSTPIEWILTVPAIWSHGAQNTTKRAALAAGIGSRPGDKIQMISEPEAAALYSLKEIYMQPSARTLQIGQQYVIVDAGGGTVDLITYEIKAIQPRLKVAEAVVGSGGKCGATSVDRAFHALLKKKLGRIYDGWNARQKGRASKLMQDFEKAKRSFGYGTETEWYIQLPDGVPDDSSKNIEEGELILAEKDMKELFEPSVSKIIQLVAGQIRGADRKRVMDIILVGGFGESQHLYKSLKNWGASQRPVLNVINPKKSWSAIVRGAVYSRLIPDAPDRKLRRHYGLLLSNKYSSIRHKHLYQLSYMNKFYDRREVSIVNWKAALGETVEDNGRIRIPLECIRDESTGFSDGALSVVGCLAEAAPEDVDCDHPDVDRLCVINYRVNHATASDYDSVVRNGTKQHRISLTVELIMGSADIKLEIIVAGKISGSGTISYDE